MQTNDFEKQKNLLDLEYQTCLNYINMLAVALAATTFAIIWSYFTDKISLSLMMSGLLIEILVFSVMLIPNLFKLMNIKEQIKAL